MRQKTGVVADIMKKIVFYGDSNTYGYDPRGYLGMRYPQNLIWTGGVSQYFSGKYDVIEEGMNGRLLPSTSGDTSYLKGLLADLQISDIFVMMLGTNDILLTDHPDADVAVEKMDRFLHWFMQEGYVCRLFIIGPVPIGDKSGELSVYHKESIRMNSGFEKLCEKYKVLYRDAGKWDIPLGFDGVHFSEDGHRVFCRHICSMIDEYNKSDL